METLGQHFKREREFKGLSLEKVSQLTRIHIDVLKSIESDNLARVQGIYLKSFIRSYATNLGLNANDMLTLFQNQMPEKASPEVTVVTEGGVSSKMIAIVGGVLALSLIVGYFIKHHH